ncbi:hypothetical protein [Nonomuraea sp. NPDC049607]
MAVVDVDGLAVLAQSGGQDLDQAGRAVLAAGDAARPAQLRELGLTP